MHFTTLLLLGSTIASAREQFGPGPEQLDYLAHIGQDQGQNQNQGQNYGNYDDNYGDNYGDDYHSDYDNNPNSNGYGNSPGSNDHYNQPQAQEAPGGPAQAPTPMIHSASLAPSHAHAPAASSYVPMASSYAPVAPSSKPHVHSHAHSHADSQTQAPAPGYAYAYPSPSVSKVPVAFGTPKPTHVPVSQYQVPQAQAQPKVPPVQQAPAPAPNPATQGQDTNLPANDVPASEVAPVDPMQPGSNVAPVTLGDTAKHGKDMGNAFCSGMCYENEADANCPPPYSSPVYKSSKGCYMCCFTAGDF